MRPKLVLAGVVLLVAAASAACGGDETDSSTDEKEAASDSAEKAPTENEADEETPSESGLAPVEFLLPEVVEVPSDYAEVLAECAEPPAEEEEYRSVYGFAVPADWKAAGRGAAGSGALASTDVDLRFETGEGKVEVAMNHDTVDESGVVLDWQNEPFTSFDEEVTWYSSEDSEERQEVTTFEDVGTITVTDQEVTLWRAGQEQNPERISSTRYKARISTVSAPRPQLDDRSNAVTRSIVVTIDHDADETPLDQAVVEQIIGSFAIAPCIRQATYNDLELMLGEDVDGDGEVRTVEDMLAELEEKQEG